MNARGHGGGIRGEEKAGFVAAIYDGIEAATEQARRLAE